ncbi:GIY-YIG nuclease family protein [Rhizobium leguminosarum]|uniref:GIY-YIG nuclease family protein n=1 Tax=Rhizobium leguminosarum TaxID=384 RepID=UPI003D7BB02D
MPRPSAKEPFRRASARYVPDRSGCYVLATFEEEVLYIGLATNLRRRLQQHLDNTQKTRATDLGRAVWFFWLETDHLPQLERTWMNSFALQHGKLPALNSIYSPVSS